MYCLAMSWNGLVAPQDDCILRVTVWALETFGAATSAAAPAVAPAAPARNLRRDAALPTFSGARVLLRILTFVFI